jgi:hypothetical protein
LHESYARIQQGKAKMMMMMMMMMGDETEALSMK